MLGFISAGKEAKNALPSKYQPYPNAMAGIYIKLRNIYGTA